MSRLVKAAVLALFALTFSSAALAQVELGETVDNNAFAVNYPSGWIVDAFLSEGEDGTLIPVVFLYSSAAVQDAVMQGNTALPQGEAVAYVASNDDGMYTVQAAMDQLIADETAGGWQFGEVSEIETDSYAGLIASFKTPRGEQGLAGVLGSRELRITFIVLAAKGDLETYEETFRAILDSIRPSERNAGGAQGSGRGSGEGSDALTLVYGETAAGVITDSDGDVWTFEGRAGDVVNIAMNSRALDPYLEVYSPDNTLVEEDNDSGGARNARVSGLLLHVDGTYEVVARTFTREGRGGYELTLTRGGSGSSGAAADEDVQSVVEDNLPLGETQRYTFTGRAGQVVTILLESAALTMDPFLNLYTSDGRIVVQDDDSAGSLNAIIENFALPADDTYTVEVTTAYGDGGGEYRLTVVGAELDDVQPGTVIPAAPGERIEIGDTVTGNLPLGETQDYTFVGRAGDVVTITLESDAAAMDPYLELRSPTQRLIAEDDDSAGSLNARIAGVRLPEDGIYTIVVRTSAGFGGGRYTLQLR